MCGPGGLGFGEDAERVQAATEFRAGFTISCFGAKFRLLADVAFAYSELANHLGEPFGLLRQGLAGGRRLFRHGRVLLSRLIEFADCRVDLFEGARLIDCLTGDSAMPPSMTDI